MILKPTQINTIQINEQAAQLSAVRFDKGSSSFLWDKKIVKKNNKYLQSILKHLRKYPHNSIFQPLANLIINIEKQINKSIVKPNELAMTHGALNGLFLSLSILCNPKDKILINELAYEGIFTVLKTLFLNYVICNYKDKSSLELAIKKHKPKLLILNSPENPSGYIYSAEELKTIGHYAEKYNLYVISDEVNNQNIYFPYVYIPPCKYIPKDKLISLNSFSKNYFLPGLRLGWLAGPKKIVQNVELLITSTQVGISYISQITAYHCLKSYKTEIKNFRKSLYEKKLLCEKLLDNKVKYLKPIMSSSVVFVNCKNDSRVFAARLLSSKNIAVTPGYLFGRKWKTWIRLGFSAVTKDEISKNLPKVIQTINIHRVIKNDKDVLHHVIM